jgi:hypothetical protein
LYYQFVGSPAPCAVKWVQANNRYEITIWYTPNNSTWILGTSILGDTTILGSDTQRAFFWLLYAVVQRLMPVTTKYVLLLEDYKPQFITNYNVDEVQRNYFYNPAILYDAYKVVNNNVNFNTQGYYLK